MYFPSCLELDDDSYVVGVLDDVYLPTSECMKPYPNDVAYVHTDLIVSCNALVEKTSRVY